MLGSGPVIDLQKMTILVKKNHLFRSLFWSWRVCKQAKLSIIWATENPHAYIEKPTNPKRVYILCGFWSRGIIGPIAINITEAHFDISGYVNKQNCRILGTENPHFYIEKPTHPKRVYILCGFLPRGIIGSIAINITEAHFDRGGYVNKQNCRICGTENPHAYIEKPTNPKRVTILCGFWSRGIIGPIAINSTEAHFDIGGYVNKQNCRSFGPQKTRTFTLKSQRTQKESLFCGDFGPEA